MQNVATSPIGGEWTPRNRAERLVSVSRCVLALTTSIALAVAPPRVPLASGLVAGVWAVSSTALVVIAWLRPITSIRLGVPAHVLDLVVIALLISLTGGVSSPFSPYLLLPVANAALRFSPRGIVATTFAASAGIVLIVLGSSRSSVFDETLAGLLVRITPLVFLAIVLMQLGVFQLGARRQLNALSAWPQFSPELSRDESIGAVIAHAIAALDGAAGWLVWLELRSQVAWKLEASAEPGVSPIANCIEAFPDDSDEPAAYYVNEPGVAGAETVSLDGETIRTTTRGLPAAIRTTPGPILSVVVTGREARGRLYVAGGQDRTPDDLVLAQIIGAFLGARLDAATLVEHLRSTAVTEERMRLGRDLHDWLLQSLTGVALQLQTLHRLIENRPENAQERISEIQETVAAEQRELRRFIENLQPRDPLEAVEQRLVARLKGLARRFEQQWGIMVRMEVDPVVHLVDQDMQREIFSIVNEAVANAAKHSGCSHVDVSIGRHEGRVAVKVEDDGHGFGFEGTYDLGQLVTMKRGPVTLKERISSLHGNLLIESGREGARLEIELPITAGGRG